MEPIRFDQPAVGSPRMSGADDSADVSEFRLGVPPAGGGGSPLSQWALARYLVGRSIASSIGMSLLLIVAVIAAVAVGLWFAVDSHLWAIFVGILALIVLLFRTLLMALVGRLTVTRQYGPLEDRLKALVRDTRSDVLAELRRIGLPGRIWSLPALGTRLVRGKTRAETFQALRQFQLGRVVPAARVDELHLLLKQAVGR
jgi:hypothetical protein